jgi:putative redox protein
MSEIRPPLTATLEWDGELQFTGQIGKHEVSMDGSADAAPTPVHLLAMAVLGCMSIDVIQILTRGRHTVTSLTTSFSGRRSPDDPKRFTHVRLEFALAGEMEPEHVERALELSRGKYCSVWQSLRQDIELETTYTIASK